MASPPADLRRSIYSLVLERGSLSTHELSAALGVSEVTIRHHLAGLAREGLLQRHHGGAEVPQSPTVELSFRQKTMRHLEEKQRIGRRAAGLVEDGDRLFLETGTTVVQMVTHLRQRRNLTVVTNCLHVALEVMALPEIRLLVVGGEAREKSCALVGPLAEQSLEALFREVHINKLFLGVDGLTLREGLTTPNLDEARLNRKMLELVPERIVVADRSKFGVVALSRIAPVEQVHTIVTDSDNHAEARLIRQAGVRILLA